MYGRRLLSTGPHIKRKYGYTKLCSCFSKFTESRLKKLNLRLRFFTKIQDQIKNPDHQDFSLGKETMYPQKDYFFTHLHRKDPQYRRYPGERITRLLTMLKVADLSLCSDDQVKDTVLNGPNEDESCNKICTGKVNPHKKRGRSCVAVQS